MGVKIWIDDVRPPPSENWIWVKTLSEAFVAISANELAEISFDHDLGGEDTTMPLAKLIEEMAYFGTMKPFKWYIHSANPVGRQNLYACLSRADKYWEANSSRERR